MSKVGIYARFDAQIELELGDVIVFDQCTARPGSDRYLCFDLPTVFSELFRRFGGVFRSNIEEEKCLSLVAIKPG